MALTFENPVDVALFKHLSIDFTIGLITCSSVDFFFRFIDDLFGVERKTGLITNPMNVFKTIILEYAELYIIFQALAGFRYFLYDNYNPASDPTSGFVMFISILLGANQCLLHKGYSLAITWKNAMNGLFNQIVINEPGQGTNEPEGNAPPPAAPTNA